MCLPIIIFRITWFIGLIVFVIVQWLLDMDGLECCLEDTELLKKRGFASGIRDTPAVQSQMMNELNRVK